MSQNIYSLPIRKEDIVRMTNDESPAHVGPLRYSVDFIVSEGTPVYAACEGTVIDLKMDSDVGGEDQFMEDWGNWIEIKHEHGEYSEYEHLRKDGVVVKVGEKVRRGQLIGYSGATGWLAHLGPHLHFMVGVYGTTVEDYQTLPIQWEIGSVA